MATKLDSRQIRERSALSSIGTISGATQKEINEAINSTLANTIIGPASATDNAIVRYDGTTGKVVQNSSVFITDTGRLGVGTQTPVADVEIYSSTTTLQLTRVSDNTGAPVIRLAKARTTSRPLVNDSLALFQYRSLDGNDLTSSDGIILMATATENHTATNRGNDLRIFTTLNGSAVNSERIRILNDGKISIGHGNAGDDVDLRTSSNPTIGVRISSGISQEARVRLIGSNTGGGISQESLIASYQPSGGNVADAALDFRVRKNGDSFGTPSTVMTVHGGRTNVGIGTNLPDASAKLELSSTTQGFLGPRLSQAERDAIVSPATGLEIYNTTTNQKNVYNGTSWTSVGSSQSLETIFQLTGEDVAQWSTGDNATFLGGGTLSGIFVSNSSSPLQSTSDYRYTQAAGSLNDYLASPIQPVDVRFRGQEVTLYFPYLYNGNNDEIRVIFYDVTNAQEIPSSVYIAAASTVSVFKTNITIPSTCQNIRIGFQVTTLNSGKIFQFDSVQLSSDTTLYANVVENNPFVRLTGANGFGSTNTLVRRFTTLQESDGSDIVWTDSATLGSYFTIKENGTYGISYTERSNANAASTYAIISKNDPTFADSSILAQSADLYNTANANTKSQNAAWSGRLSAGDIIYVGTTAPASNNGNGTWLTITRVNKKANNILTAPDTFSTDTAPLTYAGSSTYTLSTLENAPVGTFITFTYATSTNTRTQTNAAPPTQTTADMAINGIRLFTRAYNAASTAGNPAAIAIQIGKGLKGRNLDLYKSTGKVTSGSIDAFQASNTQRFGGEIKDYNESTGILIIDLGYNSSTSTTSSVLQFSDLTTQSNGYLVVNASRNPALAGLSIDRVYLEAAGNAGQVITVNVTNLPFISVEDTHSAWNGSQYTVPETGMFSITGHVFFTASSSKAVDMYIDGVLVKQIGDPVTANNQHFAITYKFTKGQVVSFRVETNGGTLSNNSIYHWLTISKVSVG